MALLSRSWVTTILAICLLIAWGCSSSSSGPAATDTPDAAADTAVATPPPPTDAGGGVEPDAAQAPETSGEAPLPTLSRIAPSSATAGSAGPALVVYGGGFVAASVVQVDGAPLPTTFVSDTELHTTIPSAKLLKAGTFKVAVGTAPPGGGLSAEATFTVDNPTPQLTQIAPQSVGLGAPATALTVMGGQFVSGATIAFDGNALPTTYTSLTSLAATIPANLLQASGNHAVVVTNPAPGGGTSTSIAFVVTNPTVSVSSVAPSSVVVGAPAQALAITGAGFIAASAVSLNGTTVPSTFVDGQHLSANVPAASFTTVGSFPVVVTNPEPGGGVSTPVMFQVLNAAPTIASLSPSGAATGSGATQITVAGSGFGVASQVTFNGTATSTTFVDTGHLQATLSAAQLAAAGTVAVAVTNPAPGGGTSGTLNFAISNPAPSVTSITPSNAPVGSPSASLAIAGTGFVFGATAQLGATGLATAYVSATQLTATVPGSLLGSVGVLALSVTNPAPGGGTSNSVSFTVGCDTTGVDVPLGAVGTVTTQSLSWAGAATSERYTSSGTCPATIPAVPTNSQPYYAFVVQNSTSSPVTLSTWAVCTSGTSSRSDAFLAVYQRPTVPATVTDRLACTGYVSEGASGTPSLSSPDANGSTWCPGLTLGNGAGTPLAACEKAVVYIQPYNVLSTTYTPPPQIRFKPE
jgi:trimeric autotransporter adhesin